MCDKKIVNCRFVKTILMLSVFFAHACAFWSGNWFTVTEPLLQSNIIVVFQSWVSSFHIYAFTLVSGYIFAFKAIGGGYNHYLPFLKNKAKRLLVPYFFVMLIWVAPISAYFFKWDFSYLAEKYMLAINPSQLWFLWMLFGTFAVVWPLRKVMIERPQIGYTLALVFYGIGSIGNKLIPNVFCIWRACQYIQFFFIGMRIRAKEEKGEKLYTEISPWFCWIIIDIVVFVCSIIVEQNAGAIWSVISLGVNFVLHIVGAIMAWSTLQMIANKVNWQKSKVFNMLASYSMPMYLFHQQIIYFTIVWLNGKVSPWINAGANFVIALAGSFVISWILMRWKTTRFLIGEK